MFRYISQTVGGSPGVCKALRCRNRGAASGTPDPLPLRSHRLGPRTGSALIASHDRYFLKRVATRVLGIADGRIVDYAGDYEAFLARSEQERAVMQVKDERRQEAERAQIKAKSKKSKAEKVRRGRRCFA